MNRRVFLSSVLSAASATIAPRWARSAETPRSDVPIATLSEWADRIRPLHDRLNAPGRSDWLAKHHEDGQTFKQYLVGRTRVRDRFSVIYIQPLGEFEGSQQRTLDLTAECMKLFFGLPVKVMTRVDLALLPDGARRVHPTWHVPQVLSTYILDKVLAPRRPDDAVAVLGLTTCDLWPGEGWNFVFGQASLSERVGVWSLFRNGDPNGAPSAFDKYLLRSLKTAVHETGHMLGIPHCIAYSCCMNGSNSLDESDRAPFEFCPECQAKIWWTCRTEPVSRWTALLAFAERNRLRGDAEFWRRTLAAFGAGHREAGK